MRVLSAMPVSTEECEDEVDQQQDVEKKKKLPTPPSETWDTGQKTGWCMSCQ